VGEEYSKTKGQAGEDIHEGKLSLIVIHSLRNSSKENAIKLMRILCKKTNDQKLIDEVIN
jgi:geranylgeranyl diphosphate synthase type 3/geranylgeranyl diphosphate synthase type I